MEFEALMRKAIDQASKSGAEVPVGAVVIDASGKVIATGHNQKEAKNDPTSHAEIEAIRAACEKLGDWRLEDCTLVVTLEPCVMCAGAILAARIPRVVFGAWDQKQGAAGSAYDLLRDHRLSSGVEVVANVLSSESADLLTSYFKQVRLPRKNSLE